MSHATPEENTFVTWLAAQLVSAGYEVWTDVTKLLGGERFWRDIEEAINDHTFRFLFVSSLLTNSKPGTLRELKLALDAQERLAIRDFIIPLKIDAFPFASMDARIKDLNFMRFDQGWATALKVLLKLLEREDAPKSPRANPAAVTEWFRRSVDTKRRVQVGTENVYSNWFRVRRQPKLLWFHDLGLTGSLLAQATGGFNRPFRLHAERLLTFANPAEVQTALGPVVVVKDSYSVQTAKFVSEGDPLLTILPGDASNMVTDLLGRAWNAAMGSKGLQPFAMANGQPAWFVPAGLLEKNQARFTRPGEKKETYRQLVGEKSKRSLDGTKARDGFWHYAISGWPQLHPFPRFVIRYHVVFSDDGAKPWTSAERMHKARRSVCKQWWNDSWRDRLFAICAFLGGANQSLELAVGDDASFVLSMKAMSFTATRRFFEGNETGTDESKEIELVEEVEEEDGDDSTD